MEGEQSSETLVVLGTALIVFVVVFVVVFMISHKRKLYALQSMNDLLENECKKEINELKAKMDTELEGIKEKMDKIESTIDKH